MSDTDKSDSGCIVLLLMAILAFLIAIALLLADRLPEPKMIPPTTKEVNP